MNRVIKVTITTRVH